MNVLQLVGVASLLLGLSVSAHGANVLIVGGAVGGETENELKALLQSMGHIVPQNVQSFAAAPPTASDLASVDLILVARSGNSGDYNQGSEPAQWNLINKPLLLMSPQISRGGVTGGNSRWGWFNNATTVDNQPAPTDFDSPYPNPAHPFVAGRTTSVFPGPPNVTIDVLPVTGAQIPGGATMVSTLSAGTALNVAGIVDIPAGTQLFADFAGTLTTTTARRTFFQMWEYPDVANRAFELTANGNQILDQIIDTLAPTTTQPGDVNLDGAANIADYTIIRNNFQGTGKTRATGDLNADTVVNFLDFRIWKNFRTGAGAGTAFEFGDPVPEPGSVLLLAMGACAVFASKRRRS